MTRAPQLLLTLSPEGAVVAELPGTQGTRRRLELDPRHGLETIRYILEAQAQDQCEIGEDGAPTQAQVQHWEKHQEWAKVGCRFCLAEGRATIAGNTRALRRELITKSMDGVEVRRIKAGQKGQARPTARAEDLGL